MSFSDYISQYTAIETLYVALKIIFETSENSRRELSQPFIKPQERGLQILFLHCRKQ